MNDISFEEYWYHPNFLPIEDGFRFIALVDGRPVPARIAIVLGVVTCEIDLNKMEMWSYV